MKERTISRSTSLTGGKRLIATFINQQPTLTAFLADKLLRPEDIDDILQEVASIAIENDTRTDIESPKAYLFIVARNLMYRHLRIQAAKMSREIDDLDLHTVASEAPSPERQADGQEALKQLTRHIKQLPPQCRKVFLLRKIKGWSHKKIAASLSISTSTVERHITNAITRLDALKRSDAAVISLTPTSSPRDSLLHTKQ